MSWTSLTSQYELHRDGARISRVQISVSPLGGRGCATLFLFVYRPQRRLVVEWRPQYVAVVFAVLRVVVPRIDVSWYSLRYLAE